jgi:enoyl-CoA hydratase/carnithine racemase
LLNRVVDPGQALTVATELAMKIIGNAPLAVQGAKRVIVESRGWPIEERFDRQAAITDVVLTSKDAQEGARAFTEKRKPVWRRA